jgi:Fe-S cluster biogenesis protein NfuA
MNKNMNIKKQVEEILNEVRPSLQADGGDVELVDVDEEKGIVKVKLTGACAHCPMSALTLQEGVEKVIKSKIKEVKEVVGV